MYNKNPLYLETQATARNLLTMGNVDTEENLRDYNTNCFKENAFDTLQGTQEDQICGKGDQAVFIDDDQDDFNDREAPRIPLKSNRKDTVKTRADQVETGKTTHHFTNFT